MNSLLNKLILLSIVALTFSCSSYKKNIMFKTPENFQPKEITSESINIIQDYIIQKNDLLTVEVFSNNGERLIDPNPELTNSKVQAGEKEKITYLVTANGNAKLPLINEVKVEGLTLRQAEVSVQTEYAKYFKDPYVVMHFANKRAVLLGATGGQVIPLNNQNMRLTEVLALGKGLDNSAQAQNIRVLRNDDVYLINLSTIEGYKEGNILIQPGDIIYVEPIRRPFTEAVRENGSIISIVVSLASLVVIILNVR
ncbi:MAG: polysaccharide biosynthesis/export family protein [Cyclobacteriaceae bacterium]